MRVLHQLVVLLPAFEDLDHLGVQRVSHVWLHPEEGGKRTAVQRRVVRQICEVDDPKVFSRQRR